jgi:sugar lactone lactonase YvrE
MWQRVIMRIDSDGSPRVHADLSSLQGGWLNDMVVDQAGRAYVDHAHPPDAVVSPFRRDHIARHPDGEGIALVGPEGELLDVVRGLTGPNGLVITADGTRLVVAESPLYRLTGFQIGADATLSGRHVFAELGDLRPDGLAIDAEDAIWVGGHRNGPPEQGAFVRFLEGGRHSAEFPAMQGKGITCALGGRDRRTLFISTIVTKSVAALREEGGCHGFIATASVDVPGDGWP